MNARDILHYGHVDVMKAIESLPPEQRAKPGVTSRWSIKDVLAHLASYEVLLEDAIKWAEGIEPRPTLEAMGRSPRTFNDEQVGGRAGKSWDEVLKEYEEAHGRVMALVESLTPDRLRQPGTISWYGEGYALDDFIVYANYAHKREHCAQIKRFRQSLD